MSSSDGINKKLMLDLAEEKFRRLNEKMKEQSIIATVVLIGGFAGTYLLDTFRRTYDIDFLMSEINNSAKRRTWWELIEDYGIEEVTVVEVPPVEEIIAHDTLTYSNLTIIIPTIEYLAITKIFSDRKKDEEDLVQQGILVNCDPQKLEEMIKLYKGDILNPNNMNYNFHTLKDKLSEYGINF